MVIEAERLGGDNVDGGGRVARGDIRRDQVMALPAAHLGMLQVPAFARHQHFTIEAAPHDVVAESLLVDVPYLLGLQSHQPSPGELQKQLACGLR